MVRHKASVPALHTVMGFIPVHTVGEMEAPLLSWDLLFGPVKYWLTVSGALTCQDAEVAGLKYPILSGI